MTDREIKIINLRYDIGREQHWLAPEQGMSNPMKIRRRKKRLKRLEAELQELLNQEDKP